MGNLWNTPVSDKPLFTEEQQEAMAERLKELEAMTPEEIRKVLQRSAKGAAELHRKFAPRQYRCCPHGCCHCRRY